MSGRAVCCTRGPSHVPTPTTRVPQRTPGAIDASAWLRSAPTGVREPRRRLSVPREPRRSRTDGSTSPCPLAGARGLGRWLDRPGGRPYNSRGMARPAGSAGAVTATNSHAGDVTFAALEPELQSTFAHDWGVTTNEAAAYFDTRTPANRWDLISAWRRRDGSHEAEVARIAAGADDDTKAAFDALPDFDPSEEPPPALPDDGEGVAPDGLRLTDAGNAQRFVNLSRGRVRYVHQWGRWIVYNKGALERRRQRCPGDRDGEVRFAMAHGDGSSGQRQGGAGADIPCRGYRAQSAAALAAWCDLAARFRE